MEAQVRTLVDISDSNAARQGHADMVLDRARWAASIFEGYDRDTTMAIVDAVAKAAHEHAAHYADAVVQESGLAPDPKSGEEETVDEDDSEQTDVDEDFPIPGRVAVSSAAPHPPAWLHPHGIHAQHSNIHTTPPVVCV